MKHVLSNHWHEVLRFDVGDNVIAGILEFAQKQKIGSAWLSAVGSSKEVELGFYHLEKQEYSNKVFKEPLELLEASGTLAVMDGKPILHLHGIFCGADYGTIGGHIQKLIANATVEVFIHKLNERLERKRDLKTGLNLLDVNY
ncbi:MAG TPA: PPC domain-containing DNA-binding protein [Candidatus Paceibacterota bacterium]|nr:PPC domain-containing DNA-binding protein [Candidatus Paceibacterota bacterium]